MRLSPGIKRLLVILILLATVVAFVLFFAHHPQYFRSLGKVNPWGVALIVGLYTLMLGILVAMYNVQLRLCGHKIPAKENLLLTAYSTLANFFGPLQSGPGVRAAYLKTKHGVRLRDYTLVSLLYYAMFAFFSAFCLLVATRPWWQTLLGSIAVLGFSAFVINLFRTRDKDAAASRLRLEPVLLSQLTLLTFVQVVLTGIIYFSELHVVHANVSPGQALSYAGAANFALFVSLTPGAIGFRESFLYFSSKLHHVAAPAILSASLVDRGAYVIFLALLFVFVLASHARDKLHLQKTDA